MTRRWLAVALAVAVVGCGRTSRFALRPPVLRDRDDRPFTPAPAEDEEAEVANGVDMIVLRPLAAAFQFHSWREAHNVNALDEVPDSTWFVNRAPSPADVARGPCPEAGPAPPFTVLRGKSSGDTPGFVVEDARGQRHLIKLDPPLPTQPEIGTAADAIVSRLYWAVGYNAPCNEVRYVERASFVLDERSTESGRLGRRRPLSRARLDALLDHATTDPHGRLRVMASRFIEGQPIGNWRTEGTRGDDPNDVIPHEDRRELRGERLLAAWVNHWDSRGPNTFDAYVGADGGGYVLHYFLDFGDSLGTNPVRTPWPEPRQGFTTVLNAPNILVDALTFGFVRRPWDEVRVDPRYPNLGFFGVAEFEPLSFSSQVPLVRWERAQPADLGWMARRLARLDEGHVRAAVGAGRLSDPAEEERLVEVLMGRRARILRAAFASSSPLADLTVRERRLCARDLAHRAGVSDAAVYRSRAFLGSAARRAREATRLSRFEGGVCVTLPPSFAPPGAPDDDPARYAVVELGRWATDRLTVLRAHLYDLDERGYRLVGVERP